MELNANHQSGYAYDDMKSDNILTDEQGQFFIIDLESSISIGEIHLHRDDTKFETSEIKIGDNHLKNQELITMLMIITILCLIDLMVKSHSLIID
jgi:serine/threonine protein kinase